MNTKLMRIKYLPTWSWVLVLRIVGLLPYSVLRGVGKILGQIAFIFAKERKEIAQKNLQLCFPELDKIAQQNLLKKNFESLGLGLVEVPLSWWASNKKLADLCHLSGLEYLESAVTKGKGVILLSAHFTSLEIGGRLLALHFPFHVMYRRNENPVVEHIMGGARRRLYEQAIPRDSVRDMIKSLREGHVVWYAPDQNTQRKAAVFVNFFGHLASTSSATARLAKITGAQVVPFKAIRRADGSGYNLTIEPPLQDFPTGDLEQDTQRINDVIERWVRENPDQYLWIHRRFRTRPSRSDPPIY